VEARGFYLTAWNGTDGYTFDRIGRGFDLHIPSVNVSMIGSTQPGRLREYISGAVRGGGADDGLIQRFSLMVWPDVSKAYVEQDREPDPVARSAAFAAFDRLDGMTAESVGATIDQFDSMRPFLRFDGEALTTFQSWRLDLERRLRAGTLHPAMESHVAKYRKLVPSLALVHHLTSGGFGPVGEVSVLAALAWSEFLETHAHRAYAAALDTSTDGAREILRHLRAGDLQAPFSARDVLRRGWSSLADKERVSEAVETLEEHGWIRAEAVPATAKGGRPTTVYTVYPKVTAR
jgi:putative DNA primase/helicase